MRADPLSPWAAGDDTRYVMAGLVPAVSIRKSAALQASVITCPRPMVT